MDIAKSLLIAPTPLRSESPASWLLRTAIAHGVSTRTILRSMGIVQSTDPDIDLSLGSLSVVARGTGISNTHLLDLAENFRYVRRDHADHNLVRDVDDLPAYCYCPLCLRSDRTPHLRSLWRFELWTICPVHRVRMSDACPGCGGAIRAHRSESDVVVTSLLECSYCHDDYTGQRHVSQRAESSLSALDLRRLETQDLFVSLIKQGRSALSGDLDIDMPFAERVASYLRFKSYSQRLYRRARA